MIPGMRSSISRAVLRTTNPFSASLRSSRSRFISTQPPHLKSRSWKSSGLRWGLAIAGIYYYNTSPVFAEQPHHNLLNPNVEPAGDDADASALDEFIARRSKETEENRKAYATDASNAVAENIGPMDGQGAAELEEEAQGEGAFNPETGEINWDCPCLGGMAHGPCGPQFREAFSCFIFSEEEPKGMDCIDKFQGMRDCFQEHPEVYKDELMDDEELDAELEAEKQELVGQIAERRKAEGEATSPSRLLEEPAPVAKTSKASASSSSSKPAAEQVNRAPRKARSQQQSQPKAAASADGDSPSTTKSSQDTEARDGSSTNRQLRPPPVSEQALPESESLLPKAAHDARDNVGSSAKKD